ncbi:unnamed protein product [Pleuronectes platessa]|uniref:Uncharacterized protein n=1 Tax=Pleuronectes platessa TaxID=8262 RepID=A0A9N7V5W0_PLEPL|nr:unnamed protein product [Pleuronectes platessa]
MCQPCSASHPHGPRGHGATNSEPPVKHEKEERYPEKTLKKNESSGLRKRPLSPDLRWQGSIASLADTAVTWWEQHLTGCSTVNAAALRIMRLSFLTSACQHFKDEPTPVAGGMRTQTETLLSGEPLI